MAAVAEHRTKDSGLKDGIELMSGAEGSPAAAQFAKNASQNTTSDQFLSTTENSNATSQQPLVPGDQGNGIDASQPSTTHKSPEAFDGIGEHAREYPPSDGMSEQSDWSESTFVPRRNLGVIQVTSLMLNSTIGSGIFKNPGFVLALTRSKRISLVLWAVGGVYSALSMVIFLEYGTALPYNGGSLIYLNEVFHRPRLLAAVVFSVYWIVLAGTANNSRNIALSLLGLANPDVPSSKVQEGLLKLTAIVVQTVACLLLFFARRLCFVLNSAAALYKILLLIVIFIAGMAASHGGKSGFKDFNKEYPGYNGADALSAMIYIIFSYQGWDNANYILGEVKDYQRTLKWAGIFTISILTCLYMLVTLAFSAVSDYTTLTNNEGQSNSALQFAGIVFGDSYGLKAAITLSMFSNLLYTTYTTAKVKQAIAWQRFIPFYAFFGRQNREFDSPGGGLFLHWLVTLIAIVCLNQKSDTRPFYLGIYSYGYQVLSLLLGIGILRLKSRMHFLDRRWRPVYMKNNFVLILVSFIFVAINGVIIVMTARPHDKGTIPRFYWAVTLLGVISVGVIYWGVLRLLANGGSLGKFVGLEIRIYEEGDNIPEDMKPAMQEAYRDGSRRRLQYTVSGPALRCRNAYLACERFILKHFGY